MSDDLDTWKLAHPELAARAEAEMDAYLEAKAAARKRDIQRDLQAQFDKYVAAVTKFCDGFKELVEVIGYDAVWSGIELNFGPRKALSADGKRLKTGGTVPDPDYGDKFLEEYDAAVKKRQGAALRRRVAEERGVKPASVKTQIDRLRKEKKAKAEIEKALEKFRAETTAELKRLQAASTAFTGRCDQ